MKNNKSTQTIEQQQQLLRQLKKTNKEVLNQTPAFLLASNCVLPEGHSYPFGNISFQFRNITCTGLEQLTLPEIISPDALQASLTFTNIGIAGKYAVTTKSALVVDIDTAGNMMPLPSDPQVPLAAGADTVPTIPPAQQDVMLDNARRQRDKLLAASNPNGQQLMSTYNTHNEVYNELFQNSEALLYSWKTGGAVAHMALDTHDATNDTNNGVVNNATKVYGSPQLGTYNEVSFMQQTAVIAACSAFGNYNAWGTEAMLDNKYTQAAVAALNFGKAVGSTNNTSDNANPMTSDEVHTAVQNHPGPVPTSTLAELQNHVDQSIGSAGAAEYARTCGWNVLNEAERNKLSYFLTRCWEEKLLSEREIETDLWTGNCQAELGEITVTFKRNTTRDAWSATQVVMPAFELDIEDSHWHGAAGDIARERLRQIYFVRSLINEKIKVFFDLTGTTLLNALQPAS